MPLGGPGQHRAGVGEQPRAVSRGDQRKKLLLLLKETKNIPQVGSEMGPCRAGRGQVALEEGVSRQKQGARGGGAEHPLGPEGAWGLRVLWCGQRESYQKLQCLGGSLGIWDP